MRWTGRSNPRTISVSFFGVPGLSSDVQLGVVDECGCLQQVLFGAPQLLELQAWLLGASAASLLP